MADVADVQWEPSVASVRPLGFRLQHGRVRAFVLERDGGVVLIDTGDAEHQTGLLARLAELNLPVSLLLLTHGHWDHVGGVAAVREVYGCPIACHELEVPRIRQETGVEADRTFGDGEEPVPGVRAVHVPGHTDGNCSLLLEKERILLAGDVLFGKGSVAGDATVNPPPEAFSSDWDAARSNLERLRPLAFDRCIMCHGEHVLTSAKAVVVQFLDRLAEAHKQSGSL